MPRQGIFFIWVENRESNDPTIKALKEKEIASRK
jgi:hypothetical protein